MAISPYEIAQSALGLTEAQLQSRQAVETGEKGLGIQKGKMRKEFEKELAAAQRAAEAELRKKHKKSKRSKILGGLGPLLGLAAGFINPALFPGLAKSGPILSGLMGGYRTADIARTGGKHAEKQARLAQAKALGISDKWKDTFLGSAARDYESKAESYYSDLISEADVSKEDLFASAVGGGMAGYSTGKALSGMGRGIKTVADIKKVVPEDMTGVEFENLLDKIKTFEPVHQQTVQPFAMGPEGMPIYDPSQSTVSAIKVPHEQLQMKYPELTKGISDKNLKELLKGTPEHWKGFSKSLDAKAPYLQALMQGLGTGITGIGKTSPDVLQGLMLLLSQGQLFNE